MRDLVDIHYPQADLIRVVMDNLSTHCHGALYEAFSARFDGCNTATKVRRRVAYWVNFPESIIGRKKEHLVLDDRCPYTSPILVLLVHRSGLCSWVKRIQIGVAQVPEKVSVQVVGARLRHRVHDATCGLSEFRAVVARANFKLSDRVRAIDIGDYDRPSACFREKRLRVVRTVHGVSIVEAGNSPETDQATGSIGGHGGSEEHKILPAPCNHWQSIDLI